VKKYQLSAAERARIEEGLQDNYEFYRDILSLKDSHFHFALGLMLQHMRELGLREFKGRTYAQWRALYRYVGRVCVERGLRYEYVADSSETEVAREQWYLMPPQSVEVLLTLTSLDNRQALVCMMNGRSESLAYIPPADLQVAEEQTAMRCWTLERHRHAGFDNRDAHRCLTCHSAKCQLHFTMHGRRTEATDAYARSGIAGLWRFLDGLWIERLSKRPVPRPLSPLSLAVRCEVHRGHMATVITTQNTVSGKLYTQCDDGWAPRMLMVERAEGTVSVQPSTVIDIVPAQEPRLD